MIQHDGTSNYGRLIGGLSCYKQSDSRILEALINFFPQISLQREISQIRWSDNVLFLSFNVNILLSSLVLSLSFRDVSVLSFESFRLIQSISFHFF